MQWLRRFFPGRYSSAVLASILGFACIWSSFIDLSVCDGFPSVKANACFITGSGSLVIWAWRNPRRYYPKVLVDMPFRSGGLSYAETVTGHRWWMISMVPLAGSRRGNITVSIPLGSPAIIFGMLAAWQLTHTQKTRRERLIAAGLCPNCEYDLRASNGRCPECGVELKAAALAQR